MLYTAGDSAVGSGAARVASQSEAIQVSGMFTDGEGLLIDEAVVTIEPAENSETEENAALDAAK